MKCAGKGAPTILLESGWAADHMAWARVQPELARVARTCSYDRAGTGRSSPGPLPRTAEAVAADLLRALEVAGIEGDLIVVGHSIGAVYARAVQQLAPRRVAGLVLVDPTVEAMAPAGLAPFIASATACLLAVSEKDRPVEQEQQQRCPLRPTEQPVATWSHRVSELEHLFPISSGAVTSDTVGRVSVTVLTAGLDLDTLSGQWRFRQHQSLAQSFPLGQQRVVPLSGHMMMRDSPEAIIEAARDLALATRRERPASESAGPE